MVQSVGEWLKLTSRNYPLSTQKAYGGSYKCSGQIQSQTRTYLKDDIRKAWVPSLKKRMEMDWACTKDQQEHAKTANFWTTKIKRQTKDNLEAYHWVRNEQNESSLGMFTTGRSREPLMLPHMPFGQMGSK